MLKRLLFQRKNILAYLIFLSFLIIFTTSVQSSETIIGGRLPSKDKQRLLAYIDTYESVKFMADPIIKPRLESLLGKELNHLKNNIDVHGPIGIMSGILFVAGNAQHQGGKEHGFVGINLYNGNVYTAMLTDGKIKVYGKEKEYRILPDGVRDWILLTWATINLKWKTPQNLELHTSP